MTFLNEHDLINLIKNNTCFKGKGSCIDLNLTNRKYSFKNSTSFATGQSDHHHLICLKCISEERFLFNGNVKIINVTLKFVIKMPTQKAKFLQKSLQKSDIPNKFQELFK